MTPDCNELQNKVLKYIKYPRTTQSWNCSSSDNWMIQLMFHLYYVVSKKKRKLAKAKEVQKINQSFFATYWSTSVVLVIVTVMKTNALVLSRGLPSFLTADKNKWLLSAVFLQWILSDKRRQSQVGKKWILHIIQRCRLSLKTDAEATLDVCAATICRVCPVSIPHGEEGCSQSAPLPAALDFFFIKIVPWFSSE